MPMHKETRVLSMLTVPLGLGLQVGQNIAYSNDFAALRHAGTD